MSHKKIGDSSENYIDNEAMNVMKSQISKSNSEQISMASFLFFRMVF